MNKWIVLKTFLKFTLKQLNFDIIKDLFMHQLMH